MERMIPFFELNGKRYEIKRTRYVMAEFDKRKSEISLSNDEEKEYVKEQDKNKLLEKLSARKDELYETYLTTFDEKDEELYNKACVAYDKLLDEISAMENVSGKYHKRILDLGEQMIIESLKWDKDGKQVRNDKEATDLWETYVNEVGKTAASELVAYTMQYLVGGDEEEENPFVVQARAKAEQTMQRKQGLKRVK